LLQKHRIELVQFINRIKAHSLIKILSLTLVTLVSIYLREGYYFGFADQWVLSLKGISWADPTAYLNDWFTESVPQPHWFFDYYTFWGEKFHLLQFFYFLYWAITGLAFSTACLWITEWFNPNKLWLSLGIPPLMILGPISPLGSGPPLLGWALPHCLGGSLAILALAGLATRRVFLSCLFAAIALPIHLQHGANATLILLVFALLGRELDWKKRGGLILTGSLILILTYFIASWRGLVNGDDFVRTCELYATFHCFAKVWPASNFIIGIPIALGAAASLFKMRADWRASLPVVALPAFALFSGLFFDWADIPYLNWLARRFNVYRFVTLLYPFVGAGFLWVLSESKSSLVQGFIAFLAYLWFTSSTAAFQNYPIQGAGWALFLVIASFATHHFLSRLKEHTTASLRPICFLVIFILPLFLAPSTMKYDLKSLNDWRENLPKLMPPGSIMVTPPHISWLRYISRRAIVADFKAIPYGGPSLREWEKRIQDLGGFDLTGEAYLNLSFDSLVKVVATYQATHVLIAYSDPKYQAAKETWPILSSSDPWVIFEVGLRTNR